MSLPPDEIPPWGTPDDGTTHHETPDHGTPDHGTPPYEAPDYGTAVGEAPVYGTPDYGTPEAKEPDLHSVDTVVLLPRRGRRASGDYDLLTVHGVQLGSLLKETSTAGLIFNPALSTTYRMLNPHGFLIATLEGPGLLCLARFVVTDLRGSPVGLIEEEIRYGAMRLQLIDANGGQLRLSDLDSDDGTWHLTGSVAGPRELGRVSLEAVGTGRRAARRYLVQLSPMLIEAHRLLAIMATVCLDHVGHTEPRRPQ